MLLPHTIQEILTIDQHSSLFGSYGTKKITPGADPIKKLTILDHISTMENIVHNNETVYLTICCKHVGLVSE